MTKTDHKYIVRNPGIGGGQPIIRGTRVSVRGIVEWTRLGVSPEEILSYVPHLSLAQIFDALSYYHDNVAEIDALIEAERANDPATGKGFPQDALPGEDLGSFLRRARRTVE